MDKDNKIIKQQNYGSFNVRIIQNEHGDNTVIYSANGTRLESYDCENDDMADRDYNTVCDTIRNVLAVIRNSLG